MNLGRLSKISILCITIMSTIPRATATPITNEILGIMAFGYGMHTFAREDKSWLGSFISMGKSGILLYTGWVLLGSGEGMQLLAGQCSTLVTAVTAYAQSKYHERADITDTPHTHNDVHETLRTT